MSCPSKAKKRRLGGHNVALLQKLDTVEERIWYAQKTIENGWSRRVLLHWIECDLLRAKQTELLGSFIEILARRFRKYKGS